jgi:hypothetical protein
LPWPSLASALPRPCLRPFLLSLLIELLTERQLLDADSPATTMSVGKRGRIRVIALHALAVAVLPLSAAVFGYVIGTLSGVSTIVVIGLAVLLVVIPLERTRPVTEHDLTRLAESWSAAWTQFAALAASASLEEARFLETHHAKQAAAAAYHRAARRMQQTSRSAPSEVTMSEPVATNRDFGATRPAAAAGAPTIFEVRPSRASRTGGTHVVIRGSGLVCTPQPPMVSFGEALAFVVDCSGRSLTVVAPPHQPGSVVVTVTNLGSAPSNALTFRYE